MGRQRIGLIAGAAAIVITAAAFVWFRIHRDASPNIAVGADSAPEVSTSLEQSPTEAASSAATVKPGASATASSLSDYAKAYREADDLLAFVRQVAPAGEAGNPDALYFMVLASRRCASDYEVFFGRGVRERSLDEVVALNARNPMGEQTMRDLWRQCASFRALAENPWRDWHKVLDQAVEARSPGAIAIHSNELTHDYLKTQDTGAREELRGRIESLARDALKSKRPEALLWLAGSIPMIMKAPDEDANGGSWQRDDMASVLIVAACQRGLDCSQGSEPFAWMCQYDAACQPFESAVDIIRRSRAERFDAVQLRANELNQKLDENRFDEIVFQSAQR